VLPGITLSVTSHVGDSHHGVGEVVYISNKLLLNGQQLIFKIGVLSVTKERRVWNLY
jgi:hypothetical protein